MRAKDDDNYASTIASTAEISSGDPTIVDGYWDDRREVVPWPGNTYIIVEKGSDRAITLTEGRLYLQSMNKDQDANNRWLCVERDGYFGYCNAKSGFYIGHDGKNGIRASQRALEWWELITPRRHVDGGYQLLSPDECHTLMAITVTKDGNSLERRKHGETLWEFLEA